LPEDEVSCPHLNLGLKTNVFFLGEFSHVVTKRNSVQILIQGFLKENTQKSPIFEGKKVTNRQI
jgi:hypothetical protein